MIISSSYCELIFCQRINKSTKSCQKGYRTEENVGRNTFKYQGCLQKIGFPFSSVCSRSISELGSNLTRFLNYATKKVELKSLMERKDRERKRIKKIKQNKKEERERGNLK